MNYTGRFDAAGPAIEGREFHPFASSHVDSFAVLAHGHAPDGALLVPDPNLLFHGEYKRAGVDLILSNDGREFVVHDYFKGEKRAALSSPDGAHLSGDLVNALAGHVQYAQAAPSTATAQVIGHVTKLAGSATAIRNGVSIILNNGDDVEKGDVLVTGSDTTLGVTFIDGTVFGLSSNARMVLNEMIYDPNGSSNSSLLSLIAGTITFVAGETAKHGDMKIDTPVATMGIRGTAVLSQISFFVPPGGGDPQPQANFQVLVEPDGTTGSYVLFDKVTLLPIGTVNQAGQMIQVSGGNVSISNALLSPDVQKLISDVFSLKFSANSDNTRLTTNFTDTVIPDSRGLAMNSAGGQAPNFNFAIAPEKTAAFNQPGELLIPFISIKSVDVIPASDKASFTIADQVIITDSNPADVLVPYIAGTGTIKSVSGPPAAPLGADLAKLLTLNAATGAISYDPAKFAFLGANQNVVIVIEFDSRVGSEIFHRALSLTITGSNDPAVISGTGTGAVKEDGGLTAHGVLMVQDIDTGQGNFQAPASLVGAYGTFTFDPGTGEWSYTLDNSAAKVRALADGQVVHDTLTVKSADGTASQLIDVTITGSNDAAVISGTANGAVKEDGKLTAGGTLTVQDIDTGQDHFQTPASLAGSYGTFTFDPATGEWSYTLDNSAAKVQALAGGQVIHDTLTVKSADDTASQLIDVTITGSNDAAVISGTAIGAVKEDGRLTACGTLTVQDVDTGHDHFQTPASLAGSYGTFTFDPATGEWSYTLDNSAAKVQALAGDEVVHDTLTVKSADSSASQLIDITIAGSNDAAVISGKLSGNVEIPDDGPGSGKLIDTGKVTDTDIDNTPNTFIPTPAGSATSNGYGTYQLKASGIWTYTLDYSNPTVHRLDEGQHLKDTFTVQTIDGTAKVVTITISDDDPPHRAPAGVAGSEINLGLADPFLQSGAIVTVTLAGVADDWIETDGVRSADGTWSVQTADPGSLSITTPGTFEGAAVLKITEVVTTQDGTSTNHVVADNVEAYAQGTPIFAYAGDDFLTAASGHDLIVFSQPIGHDLLYNFDVRADQIDLIRFSATDFGAVQAHMLDDVSGGAVIALRDEQSITLPGILSSSLTASNFVFDLARAFSNVGTMSVSDGALLPISGEMNNTGTVLVSAAGDETIVQLIQPGLTLKGGGQFLLSDDNSNIISGTSPNVTLNNENNVISGAGQLGNGQLNFINAGNVNATGNQPLIIDTGSNVIHNAGILEASGPGGLIVVSAVDNSGFLWANTANLTVKGAVCGNGTAIIDGPSLLEFEAASNANVVFGLASGGTLSLGDAFHFNGTISGFNDLDVIELNNFNPDSTTISYVQNANTGGTLTIANGAEVAHLTLLGDYTADAFNLVSDLPGHALVTYAHQGIIS